MEGINTLLLTRHEVASLLSIQECITAVEKAFVLLGKGEIETPGILGIHALQGGFHIKAGVLNEYFVAKANGNFPHNMKVYGLPMIQGVLIVCSSENGRVLALMDSMEITIIRTGAATAVAARHLSRADAKVATICGCGNQGRISLRALMKVRTLKTVYAFDTDRTQAQRFAAELSSELMIPVVAVDDLKHAVRKSIICITCTPSKQFFIDCEDVMPGTFIAAVGSDSEDKQELDPALLVKAKVICDSVDQCSTIGELHHALKAGLLFREDVHAELGEILAGKKLGRTSDEEVIIFDSTGTALQDLAAASIVYEKALRRGIGLKLNFAG